MNMKFLFFNLYVPVPLIDVNNNNKKNSYINIAVAVLEVLYGIFHVMMFFLKEIGMYNIQEYGGKRDDAFFIM